MVLVCPKILQDYIISVMRLYGQEPTKLSYHTAKFGGHKHFGCGMFSVCLKISQDNVIKRSSDFVSRSLSW